MMTMINNFPKVLLSLAIVCAVPAHATLLSNGGFESGLTGWTVANQTGSEGDFFSQSGTQSPVNMTPVPAPPEGSFAAMSDALGPGSHVLYQDFIVPANLPGAVVSFSLYINNAAPDFFAPPHLDFAGTDPDPLLRLNQQVRVDLVDPAADVFSVAVGDVLQNLFQTLPGDALVSGYNSYSVDVSTLLQTLQGQTVRLRFAEVDNVFTLNLGVDAVEVRVVPEPSTWLLTIGAIAALGLAGRRHRR
jgi:hypothetical protein